MTVATAFTELEQEFKRLEQTANNVSWAVVQGRPSSSIGNTMADHYESSTTDFVNLVRIARASANNGKRATSDHGDPVALRTALVTCQECAIQLARQYYGDIASCERIADLSDLAKRGGRDWSKWVLGVRDSLSDYPEILHAVSQALFRCWQEITEPIGPMSVSAQATSIGPRIFVRSVQDIDTEQPTEVPPQDETVRIDT